MILSIEDYNRSERECIKGLANLFIMGFRPETFLSAGDPTRISSQAEIIRFVDSMHAGRLRFYVEDKGFALTSLEFEKAKEIMRRVYDWTNSCFGRGIVVQAPLIAAIHEESRILSSINYKSRGKMKLFELGGGCGILGSLLHDKGYEYAATDITQAYYLTQNAMWEGLFPKKVTESLEFDERIKIEKDSILHIPYWRLWDLRLSDLECDVLIANHMLSEMHDYSLRFYLRWSHRLFRNSKCRLVVAQGPGSVVYKNFVSVVETFNEFNFKVIYSDARYVIFRLFDENERLKEDNNAWINKYETREYDWFPVYVDYDDDYANAINNSYQLNKDIEKVNYESIVEFVRERFGNVKSPDEEFVDYIGYEFV